MFTSFASALTGLDAAQVGVDTVGTNLANLTTTGYKAATVSFYDLVAQNLGLGNGSSVGLGTGQPQVTTEFTQGAIQTTGGALDGAIQGDGFFVVQDPSTGATEYTRAGNFQVDANGNLMTATGQFVQGWSSDGRGAEYERRHRQYHDSFGRTATAGCDGETCHLLEPQRGRHCGWDYRHVHDADDGL